MDHWQFLFILLMVLLSWTSSECSLISQSSIRTCQVGDSNEPSTNNEAGRTCKEKIVVSMTLMSDQQNSESLYANVREVYQTGESTASLLKKPFRIEISKSETISSYRVYYRGSANAKPSEHSSLYEWRENCRDHWSDAHLSRPRQPKADGGLEWDSQGFCCRCGSKRQSTYIKRPGAFCGNRDVATLFWHGYIELENDQLQKYGSSIHYMKMNDKWYDVFDIDQPILQYKVMVTLLEYNGILGNTESGVTVGNWTLVSSFELSPSNTVSRSPSGRVVARIEGELLGSSDPYDFITKKLLVPSSRVFSSDNTQQPQDSAGMNEWMLVEESMVDLSGKECNKIGTSFTAFRSQPVACQRESGTCFSNQPLDLLKHDGELLKRGKMGKYLLRNYGQVHPSTHPDADSFILRFVHTSLHNSFVTFYIDASDIQFVFNSVRGRIVDVTASDFTVNEESGLIVVDVENVGEIAGDFLVSLAHCHDDRVPSSKKTSIAPGQIKSVSFAFQAFVDEAQEVRCVVELYDVNYNLLGTSNVELNVNVSCFCYGECGCECSDNGTVTVFECPEEPPVVIETGPIFLRLFLIVLRMVGIHGIVGFFGGILLILGFIKLLFGGVCCCRKSKAQAYYDEQRKKGARVQQAKLFKCTGECRGAKMAKARQKRKVKRIRNLGKDPYRLDDWRNSSFVCSCNDELTDIRFANILKSLCFFYYCFFLPIIWLGRKIWWSVFRDTMKNKEVAKRTLLRSAKKDGKLETLGMVDIGAELKNLMTSDKKNEQLAQSAQKAAVLENKTKSDITDTTPRLKTKLGKNNQKSTAQKKSLIGNNVEPALQLQTKPNENNVNVTDQEKVKTEVPANLADATDPKANKKKKWWKKDGKKSKMDSQKSTEQVESFHSALELQTMPNENSVSATDKEKKQTQDPTKLAATSEPVPENLGDPQSDKANKKKKGSKKDEQKSKKEENDKTKELDTHIKKDRNIDRTAQKERKLTSRMDSAKPSRRVPGKSKRSDWMNEDVPDWDRADRNFEKASRRDERDRRSPREPRSTSRSRRDDRQSSERRERRGQGSRSRGPREKRGRSSRSRGTREKREHSSKSRGAREKRPREKTRSSRGRAAREDKKDHNSDSDESKKEDKLPEKKSLSSIESKHEALAEKVSSHHSKELNHIYDEITSQHSSRHSLASNSKKDTSVHSQHSSHHGSQPSVHSQHSSHHGSQPSVHSHHSSHHESQHSHHGSQPSVHSQHSSHHGSQPSVHSQHSSHHESQPSVHSQHSSHHGSQHSSHHGSPQPSVHSDHSSHHGSQPSEHESTHSSSFYSDSKDDLHSSQASVHSGESNNANSSHKSSSHSTEHTGVATSSSSNSTSQTDSTNLLSHTSSASNSNGRSSHSTDHTGTMKSSSTSSHSHSSTNSPQQSQETSDASSEDNHDDSTEQTHSKSSDHSDSKETTEHTHSESSDHSDNEPSEESDHSDNEPSEESSDHSDNEPSEESSNHSDNEPSEESDHSDSKETTHSESSEESSEESESEDHETDASDEESESESSSELSDSEHSQTDISESSSSEHSSHPTSHTPSSHSHSHSHSHTSSGSHTRTMSSYTSSTLSSIESRRP